MHLTDHACRKRRRRTAASVTGPGVGNREGAPNPAQPSAPNDWPLRRREVAHAQTNATLPVDLEHFHLDDVAFLELVAHALDTFVRDLRDVYESVPARQDR